jgi:hypothetical protein
LIPRCWCGSGRESSALLAISTAIAELQSARASCSSRFAGIGFVLEEIQAADDVVAVAALYRGTGRRSGAPFEGRIGHLFTLRDGLITRWEVFDDPARAFRAAGLADVGLGPEPGSPDA